MNLPVITVKIDDRVYRLDISDGPAIRKIPKQDRQHLLMLLSAIQKQEHQLKGEASALGETTSHDSVQEFQQAVSQNQSESVFQQKPPSGKESPGTIGNIQQGKFSSKDADQLMARLIAEEKKNSKSLSKRQLYVIFSTAAVIVLLLLLLFI